MGLCGCFQPCNCSLNVEPAELLSLSGNGDTESGGWTLTATETVFSATSGDDSIEIVPGGSYGHEPEINLRYEDTDSVDLSVGMNGLKADVRIDPMSPAPITITDDGLYIPYVPASGGDVPTGAVLDYFGPVAPSGWLICDGSLVNTGDYPALFSAIGHAGSAGVDPGGSQFTIPDLRGRVTVGLDNMGGTDAGRLSVANTLGGTGGVESVQLAVAEIPAHSHTVSDPGHAHAASSSTTGSHTHQPGTTTRSFVTASTATLTNVEVNTTNPDNVTRYVAGSSGGPTVQQLDLGIGHSIVVSNAGADFDTAGQQLNNANTSVDGAHSHTISVANATTGVTVLTSGGSGDALGDAHENMQPYMLVNKIIKT